jgi:uncharacterized protein YraI
VVVEVEKKVVWMLGGRSWSARKTLGCVRDVGRDGWWSASRSVKMGKQRRRGKEDGLGSTALGVEMVSETAGGWMAGTSCREGAVEASRAGVSL